MPATSSVRLCIGALVPLCAVLVCTSPASAAPENGIVPPLTKEQKEKQEQKEQKAALLELSRVKPLTAGRLVGSRQGRELCRELSDRYQGARTELQNGDELLAEIKELEATLPGGPHNATDPLPKDLSAGETLRKKLKARRAAPTYGDLEAVRREAESGQKTNREVMAAEVKSLSERLRLRQAWVELQLRSCTGAEKSGEYGSAGGAADGVSWQAAVVTGLANFIADRAQQELVQWLQEQLFTKLCKDLGEVVFSNTCEALDSRKKAPAALGRYFAGMVRKDLEQAPAALLYLGLRKAFKGNETAQEDLKLLQPVMRNLSAMVLAMKAGDSPLELLARLGEETQSLGESCKRTEGNLPCAVALIGAWVKYTGNLKGFDKNRLENPEELKKYLIGVLANQNFVDALTLTFHAAQAPAWLSTFMQELGKKLKENEGNNTLAALEEAVKTALEKDPDSAARLQSLFRAIAALEQRLTRLNDLQNRNVAFRIEWAADVSRLTLSVLESASALVTSPDAKVVAQLQSLQHAFAALTAFSRGEYAEGMRETLMATKNYIDYLPKELSQFLPLLADLAGANTVDEVQSALSAAAAPLGSWRAKRQKPWSVTISALAGLGAGGEFPMGSRLSFTRNAGLAGGPLAAVGFDLAFRVKETAWTLGPFISVLDVGQLAYARIYSGDGTDASGTATTSASTASEVSVLGVLSPGVYLRAGAGNSPLTFGLGASIGPQLRQYLFTTATGAQDKELFSMLRLMAFVAVDVTLFRIH